MRTTNQMIYGNVRTNNYSSRETAANRESTGLNKDSKADQYMAFADKLMNEQFKSFSAQIMKQTSVLNYNSGGLISGQASNQAPKIGGGFKQLYKELELEKLNISQDDTKKLEVLFMSSQTFMKAGRNDQAKSQFEKMQSLISSYEGLENFSDFAKEHNLEDLSPKKSKEVKKLFDKMNQFALDGDHVKAQLTKESLYSKLGKDVSYPAFDDFISTYKLDEVFDDADSDKAKIYKSLRTHFDKASTLEDKGKTKEASKEFEKLHNTLDKFIKYKPFESISKTLDFSSLDLSDEEITQLKLEYNNIRKLEGQGQSDQASQKWSSFLENVDDYLTRSIST